MPYADNHGVRIFFQVVGQGAPLVLLHGLYASSDDWIEAGYVAALKDQYQLLLIDGRGHGVSEKPHEPEAYAMQLLVSDIIAVLDEANTPKAHFWGYSWGACIGFGIGRYAPERFQSLILGGHAAQGGDPQTVAYFVERLQEGPQAFAAMLDAIFAPSQSGYKARRLPSDYQASIATTLAWGQYAELETGLENLTIPCLLYAGEADEDYVLLRANAARIPQSKLLCLPALDHLQTFVRSDLVLPHIRRFLLALGEAASC